jgi:signal transduction histidine kinase
MEAGAFDEGDLVLLDDVRIGRVDPRRFSRFKSRCDLLDNSGSAVFRGPQSRPDVNDTTSDTDTSCGTPPAAAASNDVDVLRAALIRESGERRRAECRADMQTEIAKLALDLLVREPDVDGFFGALTKVMVEESESHTCGVWLIDDAGDRCELWMIHLKDRLYMPKTDEWEDSETARMKRCACESLADHLFQYRPGWQETIEYRSDDPRLPDAFRAFAQRMHSATLVATPLALGSRNLGWMTISTPGAPQPEMQWWRVALLETMARHAALALHHNRLVEQNRREERRKGILEERNRLARDIHDTLAQGFAAILMQLQAAQREAGGGLPAPAAASIEMAVDLARTHLTEARRSVGALRPNVGQGEDLASALKRLADMGRRTAGLPIDLAVDELPRLGDAVEREIIGIAQEALTNALRHSRARRITVRASAVQSVGIRVSVADDGRGIARDGATSGFGMTSMQERADKIGASLTIVTAPRNGTEVVLAWDPACLPTQVHVAG